MSRQRAAATELPGEFALAVACAMWPNSERRVEAVRHAASRIRDWDRFQQVVARQRIAGLAHDGIAKAGVALPNGIAAALADRARALARESLLLVAEAIRLRDAFAAAKIPVAFIKGPTLAILAYGTLGIRHSKDLDLLVMRDHAVEASKLVERLGYVRTAPRADLSAEAMGRWAETHKDFELFHQGKRIQVELHWRLTDNPWLMTDVPAPSSWIELPVAGAVALPTLAADDLFIYLCAHGANHAWFRLKWLADIGALLEAATEPGVERLLSRAASQGLERPARQAMLLSARLLGTRLPGAESWPMNDRASPRLAAMALRAMSRGGGAIEPHDLAFGSTWMKLSQYLLRPEWRFRSAQIRIDMMSDARPDVTGLHPLLRIPRWAWNRAVHGGRSRRRRPTCG